MKRFHPSLLALLCAALFCNPAQARPFLLHVAANGDDARDGKRERAGGGSGPVATLERALALAREARTSGLAKEGVVVRVGTGRLSLNAPLALGPEDSGASAQAPLVIEGMPGGSSLLSGGTRITGWQPVPGKPGYFQVQLPEVQSGRAFYRQLFVNGERRQRARTPNSGFFVINGGSPDPAQLNAEIPFKAGDVKPEWAADGDVELVALLAWADLRYKIRSVDTARNVVTLAGQARPSNREDRAHYYIENAHDALDQPGEWYLNRKTGMLTYFAKAGEDPNRIEMIVPRLHQLVSLRGDFTKQASVHDVTFRNLRFEHTDWTMPENGYADTQAAVGVHGDFFVEAAESIQVEDCTFAHLGNYAVELGRGAKRCRIVGNEIFDIGGGGVRIGEGGSATEAFNDCGEHAVTDNHIHHLGEVFPSAIGVFVMRSGRNRIAHNHIHHLYYTAISVGWMWGYQETPCRDNVIEFNHLHHVGQDRLSDMGGIYTLGIQRGSIVRNNLIHDVSAHTYGGWGLYTDEGSSYMLWESNVVYRCKSAGFHQHYGRENTIRNNILVFNREHELMRTRDEDHLSFFFTNNVVVLNQGDLLGSSWKNDRFVIERNVYFDTRLGTNQASLRFAGATLEKWRARGHDTNSVLVDPLFVAREKDNFQLKKNSPAFALGFKPIDMSTVGVRPKGKRL